MLMGLDAVVEELGTTIRNRVPMIDQARIIYDWMLEHVRYDDARKRALDAGLDEGYPRHPEETLRIQRGVCSDQSLLYVTICRSLGIPASYAHVSRDEKGQPINHAMAVVHHPDRELQVDPAMRIFNAHHQEYEINDIVVPALRHQQYLSSSMILKPLAVAALATIAWFGYQYAPSFQGKRITAAETENAIKFYTKNGELTVSIDADAKTVWKEALFFTETKEGDANDHELLDILLRADADADNRLTLSEAKAIRDRARATYVRR